MNSIAERQRVSKTELVRSRGFKTVCSTCTGLNPHPRGSIQNRTNIVLDQHFAVSEDLGPVGARMQALVSPNQARMPGPLVAVEK